MTDVIVNKPAKKGRWAKKRSKRRKEAQSAQNKVDSYRKTARLRLQAMLKAGQGTSRDEGKKEDTAKSVIYSNTTYNTYKQQFKRFADWLEENHQEAHSIEDARKYVDDYLTVLIEEGKSASSIATAKAALSKVFKVSSTAFRETPERLRANIKRSRYAVDRDRHISKGKEEELARFTSALGLRRKEMLKIEAEDLFFKDGKAYLNVAKGTKGGKSRVAEIVGSTESETKEIIKWIQSKKGRLFKRLSTHYDNHYYRATYAMRIYKKYERNLDKIPRNERYVMRKDRAGEVYDKYAMMKASQALGHNRISVIAQSYLYQQ